MQIQGTSPPGGPERLPRGASKQNGMSAAERTTDPGKEKKPSSDVALSKDMSIELQAMMESLGSSRRSMAEGINTIRAADGRLEEIESAMERLKQAAAEATNGILSSGQREALQEQLSTVRDLLERVAEEFQFEGVNILDGAVGNIPLHTEVEGGGTARFQLPDTTVKGLGLEEVDFSSPESDAPAKEGITAAVEKVVEARTKLGSAEGELTTALRGIDRREGLRQGPDRIKDAEEAVAMARRAKEQIVGHRSASKSTQAHVMNARAAQLLAS